MPKTTVPNQKLIHIHRERAASDFLGIKNENWQAASRTLGAHALRLYLYLASNANNYELALSPAAIEASIGMPRSTYHDQFRKLVNFGYLVPTSGNRYDFYETPQQTTEKEKIQPENGYNFEGSTTNEQSSTKAVPNNTPANTEINNISKKNNSINNGQEKQVSPATERVFYVF